MNTAKRYPTHKPPRPRSGAAPTALRSRGRRRRSAAHQRCPIMVHYFAKTGAVTRHTTIGTPAQSERSTIGSTESHTLSQGHVMLWGQSRPQCPPDPCSPSSPDMAWCTFRPYARPNTACVSSGNQLVQSYRRFKGWRTAERAATIRRVNDKAADPERGCFSGDKTRRVLWPRRSRFNRISRRRIMRGLAFFPPIHCVLRHLGMTTGLITAIVCIFTSGSCGTSGHIWLEGIRNATCSWRLQARCMMRNSIACT